MCVCVWKVSPSFPQKGQKNAFRSVFPGGEKSSASGVGFCKWKITFLIFKRRGNCYSLIVVMKLIVIAVYLKIFFCLSAPFFFLTLPRSNFFIFFTKKKQKKKLLPSIFPFNWFFLLIPIEDQIIFIFFSWLCLSKSSSRRIFLSF